MLTMTVPSFKFEVGNVFLSFCFCTVDRYIAQVFLERSRIWGIWTLCVHRVLKNMWACCDSEVSKSSLRAGDAIGHERQLDVQVFNARHHSINTDVFLYSRRASSLGSDAVG
jgi:hypothetical protein